MPIYKLVILLIVISISLKSFYCESSLRKPEVPASSLTDLYIDTSVGKIGDHFDFPKPPDSYRELCLSNASSTTINTPSPRLEASQSAFLSPIRHEKTTPILVSKSINPHTLHPAGEVEHTPRYSSFPPLEPNPILQAKSTRLTTKIAILRLISNYYSATDASELSVVDDLIIPPSNRTTHKSMGPRRIERLLRISPKTLEYYEQEYRTVMNQYDAMTVIELHSINPYRSAKKEHPIILGPNKKMLRLNRAKSAAYCKT